MVPMNNTHAGRTSPQNNTHAGGNVLPNNKNMQICYLVEHLKNQMSPQKYAQTHHCRHCSERINLSLGSSVPLFRAFKVVCVIHTLTSLLSLLGWECPTDKDRILFCLYLKHTSLPRDRRYCRLSCGTDKISWVMPVQLALCTSES